MLSEIIRTKIDAATKARDTITRDVLRVVLGEIETLGSKAGHKSPVTDAEAEKIVRKMVASNQEMIDSFQIRATKNPAELPSIEVSIRKLRSENTVLESFLPKTLSQDVIRWKLSGINDQIVAAKNDGQAVGIAMEYLKGKEECVLGDDVKSVVGSVRALVETA